MPICPFIAGDLQTGNIKFMVYNSEMDTSLIEMIQEWEQSDFKTGLILHVGDDMKTTKRKPYQKFLNEQIKEHNMKHIKLLVFSPFGKSIEKNFKNFDKIWNGKIKPNFELQSITYPTALTITEDSKFKDYKEIYDHHIKIINETDFDVGIFGTGYTGLLFASECKKIGKSGIHLGGATQILFGVLGNRWKDSEEFKPFINENWSYPSKEETPRDVNSVEDACYWG